jgi:hypothetical protein
MGSGRGQPDGAEYREPFGRRVHPRPAGFLFQLATADVPSVSSLTCTSITQPVNPEWRSIPAFLPCALSPLLSSRSQPSSSAVISRSFEATKLRHRLQQTSQNRGQKLLRCRRDARSARTTDRLHACDHQPADAGYGDHESYH